MMPFQFTGWLTFDRNGADPIFIPRQQHTGASLPSSLFLTLGPGWRQQVPVRKTTPPSKNEVRCPVQVIRDQRGHYRAGPFVAILAAGKPKGFSGVRSNFLDLIHTGRRMGVTVFVITPAGLKRNDKRVEGFIPKRGHRGNQAQWISATFPMPHVVYNRIPNRQAENRAPEQQALAKLSAMPGVHLFNPSFFNKWELFLRMKHSTQLARLLPDTVRWEKGERLEEMAQKHPTLFLKPVNGKAGHGMIRITRKERGFEIVDQKVYNKKRFHVDDMQALKKKLNLLTGNRRYVLQQGIQLATYGGRPFDLRILMQKNGAGKWSHTGIGIRVAGKEAISTHVPMGGSIADSSRVLQSLFGKRAAAVTEKIRTTTLDIARHIEQEEGKNLGEMSMDLGLETNEKLWFFEANAKPMKFDEPGIRRLSLQRLLQYCLFLSGFPTVTAGR